MESVASAPSQLPVEIWERVIDAVVWNGDRDALFYILTRDYISLSHCAMVCRSWLPRSRFHLCESVELLSQQALASFSLFLCSSPHLSTRIQHLELNVGRSNGTTTTGSWISCVPLLLPVISQLQKLTLVNIDFEHQHIDLYKTYTKFRGTHTISFVSAKYRHLNQFTRFALAVRARHLIIVYDCTLVQLEFDGLEPLDNASPHNRWLEGANISFSSWTQFSQARWRWTQGCPMLYMLDLGVASYNDWEDIETAPGSFILQHADIWRRICAVFCGMRSYRIHHRYQDIAVKIQFDSVTSTHVVIGKPGNEQYVDYPALKVVFFHLSLAVAIATVSKLLPLLSACHFKSITLVTGQLESTPEDYSPEKWKAIDEALSLYHSSLHSFDIILPGPTYLSHGGITPEHDCVDGLVLCLMPQTAARGLIKNRCHDSRNSGSSHSH